MPSKLTITGAIGLFLVEIPLIYMGTTAKTPIDMNVALSILSVIIASYLTLIVVVGGFYAVVLQRQVKTPKKQGPPWETPPSLVNWVMRRVFWMTLGYFLFVPITSLVLMVGIASNTITEKLITESVVSESMLFVAGFIFLVWLIRDIIVIAQGRSPFG